MNTFFVLVVALIVDGEVSSKLMFPLHAYDSQQACELEAEPYDLVQPVTLNGVRYEFRTVCVEQEGPAGRPIKRVV